jgi:hypothetical protein
VPAGTSILHHIPSFFPVVREKNKTDGALVVCTKKRLFSDKLILEPLEGTGQKEDRRL